MKHIFLILFAAFIVTQMVSDISPGSVTKAQTVVTDSGKVSKEDQDYWTFYSYGYLKQTDTVITKSFPSNGHAQLIDVWVYLPDTPKVTIKRQISEFPNIWTTHKTIVTSDSITTAHVFSDTLTNYAAGNRIVLIGTSGNGYHGRYYVKVKGKKFP